MDQLTKEQIANWRNILILTLGPYALLMPDEEILAYHAMMQAAFQQRRAVELPSSAEAGFNPESQAAYTKKR